MNDSSTATADIVFNIFTKKANLKLGGAGKSTGTDLRALCMIYGRIMIYGRSILSAFQPGDPISSSVFETLAIQSSCVHWIYGVKTWHGYKYIQERYNTIHNVVCATNTVMNPVAVGKTMLSFMRPHQPTRNRQSDAICPFLPKCRSNPNPWAS